MAKIAAAILIAITTHKVKRAWAKRGIIITHDEAVTEALGVIAGIG